MQNLKNKFSEVINKNQENGKTNLKEVILQVQKWIEINYESPEKFFRINLYRLSDELNIDLYSLINGFLILVKEGIFILNWEYHCPHCNGLADFKHNFSELRGEGFCSLCDVKFLAILDQNIEVTFTIHPEYYLIPSKIEEEYRNDMYQKILQHQYQLEKPFLTGLECINSHYYQELFGNYVLSVEESLSIQNIVIMFTDLKDSTAMYNQFGDTVSYNIVREHFKLLFVTIENHHGVVIKTIGDAVMASFIKTEDAIKASLEIFQNFLDRIWDPAGRLEIKIGLHRGPVIVVNSNEHLDYFGHHVNIASRIQSQLKKHSVGFTESIFHDRNIKTLLLEFIKQNKENQQDIKLFRKRANLKGIQERIPLYYLTANKSLQ
jgi:class 3 adenylate cyclase